jgi:hypothetical protein
MDSAGEDSLAQLSILVKEWMKTENEIRVLSAEVSTKRKRIKVVRSMITTIMKGKQLARLNTSGGALTRKVKKAKVSMTKKYIATALVDFFDGNKEMAEKCAKFLDEHRPMRESEHLALENPE